MKARVKVEQRVGPYLRQAGRRQARRGTGEVGDGGRLPG